MDNGLTYKKRVVMPAMKTKTIKVSRADKSSVTEFTPDDLQALFQDFVAGNIADSVSLPPGEDLNEWLAVNVSEFFGSLKMLYSAVADSCVEGTITCMEMNAGEGCKYLWQDGRTYKKPTAVSAPTYIRLLFIWTQNQLDDETLFPTDPKVPLPKDFPKVVRNIFRRLFRVYAHIFMCHYKALIEKGLAQTFNTCLKHFLLFVQEFQLIESNELEPLRIILDKI